MHEHKIISALIASRTAYVAVSAWLDDADFTAKGWVLVEGVRAYYKADVDAQAVDREILLARIGRGLSNAKALQGFSDVLDQLPNNIGAKNVANELLTLKRDAAADRLAMALGSRSGVPEEKRTELMHEYTALKEAASLDSMKAFDPYSPSVTKLFRDTLADTNRIKLHPPALNDRLDGGPLPGHCVVLFGRVEMGKSTQAINATAGFIYQGKRVLFIENEDPLSDTRRRITQRLLRKTRPWIQANPEESERLAEEKGIGLLTLLGAVDTPREVDAAIKQFGAQVCVINQMRNMAGGENVVQQLDALAFGLRNVGKQNNCVMFLVTAAKEGEVTKEGTIRPKPVLEVGDVYSSRTGIPAAADLLIGWGGSDQLKSNEMACISICKNKLVDGNTTADGKHNKYGHFFVKVNPQTGVVYSES